jgi:hypothetical protein
MRHVGLLQRTLQQCSGGEEKARYLLRMRKCVGPTPSHAKAWKHEFFVLARRNRMKRHEVTRKTSISRGLFDPLLLTSCFDD